jgi:hypothetical protein
VQCPQCPPPAPEAALPQRTSTYAGVPDALSTLPTPNTSGDLYTGYTPSSAVLLQQTDDKVVDLAFRDGRVVPAVSRTRVYCMVPASVTTQQVRWLHPKTLTVWAWAWVEATRGGC